MTNWMHGYFAESGYTYGFYDETAPLRLHWAALLQGVLTPTERFRYLDLGCGQGLNLILCAAAFPEAEFVGIDFMPEHVAHARNLITEAGLTNVKVIEGDFMKLANDPGALGEFDYVVAHGITTWVHSEVRDALFSLAGQVMKPGGVMYNSYNTLPGWLSAWPFQKLVALNLEARGGSGAVASARDFVKSLKSHNANIAAALPTLISRVDALERQDPAYLVQEYCNANWTPCFSSDMHEEARNHKLSYLGPATLPEAFDGILPEELRLKLREETNFELREVMRDIYLNQSFRRDLYVKGARRAPRLRHIAALRAQRLMRNPLCKRPDAQNGFAISAGSLTVTGKFDTYAKVLDFVESRELTGRVSVGDLADAMQSDISETVLTVSMLIAGGWLWLEQTQAGDDGDAFASALRLNAAIGEGILAGEPYRYLCLPRCGGAFVFSDLTLMTLALERRNVVRDDIPRELATALSALGRGVTREGTAVTGMSDILSLLGAEVDNCNALKPLLRKVGAL